MLPVMRGGPANCQVTKQSATASWAGRATAMRSGTSTSCPGGIAGRVTRVRPHHAYCRTGGSAPAAVSATDTLLLLLIMLPLLAIAAWPSSAATGGAGSHVGTPTGTACASGSLPTSMQIAAGAAMVLRSISVSGTAHRPPDLKSCWRLAGPCNLASIGGAACSLHGKGQHAGKQGGVVHRACPQQ